MLVSRTSDAPPSEQRKLSANKAKSSLHEFEHHVKDVRTQLNEQLRCLDNRTEAQTAILLELNDFFRRKAEIDGEYGKQLEKLARNVMQKHKNERFKRESWLLHSSCALWQQLVDQTKEEARQKMALAEMYAGRLTTSITQRADDLNRISRKCREIGALAHGEISRVLSELHTAMKTYQLCFIECSAVENKFRQAEENKQKYEESNPTKLGVTRKHRSLAKLYKKKLDKYNTVKLKCLKARNEYLLCVQAANAALHKYFADDISDLIDCMDLGMDQWLRGLITCNVSLRKDLCQKEMDALAEMCDFKESLDAKADKQRFIESNHATFMLPKRFEYKGQVGDTVNCICATDGVAEELKQRHTQIERRLANVRLESEEIWKTLQSTEKAVAEKFMESMVESSVFNDPPGDSCKDDSESTSATNMKNRININELYDYYLGKFSHYMLNSNLIERLEARSNGIASALNGYTVCTGNASMNSALLNSNNSISQEGEESDHSRILRSRPKKRIGSGLISDGFRRPRLFGGSLDEYVEATDEAIPLVVTSTIRVLSQFALHHQGIFRISGSQIEINLFKEAFERGDDPLRNVIDATDVNSIAGVLKLYLRELREPLFPIFLFDQLTECAKCSASDDFIQRVIPLINKLSQPTQLVLRYLFAFLNHLSEFSDENMMDPYNLAICFGPTLLPIPEGKDQVFYHNFVNELVKNLILYHDQVFPSTLPGPRYEKYLVESEQALYIDEQESAISGDEDVPTTPVFDCCVPKPPLSTNKISSSPWNAENQMQSKQAVTMRAIASTSQSISDNASTLRDPTLHNELLLNDHPVNAQINYALNGSVKAAHRQSSNFSREGCELAALFKSYDTGSPDSLTSVTRDLSNLAESVNSNQERRQSQSQVWSRRACGVSSLREQLHHTRVLQSSSAFKQLSPSSASLDTFFDGGQNNEEECAVKPRTDFDGKIANNCIQNPILQNHKKESEPWGFKIQNMQAHLARSLSNDMSPNEAEKALSGTIKQMKA